MSKAVRSLGISLLSEVHENKPMPMAAPKGASAQSFQLRSGDAVHVYRDPQSITLQLRHEVPTEVYIAAMSFKASVVLTAADGSWVVRPGTGALDAIEAKAMVKELERLGIQQGYGGTLGVVTSFRAQTNRIRDLVNAHPIAPRWADRCPQAGFPANRF